MNQKTLTQKNTLTPHRMIRPVAGLPLVALCLLLSGGLSLSMFAPSLYAAEKAAAETRARPPVTVETAEVRVADSDRLLSAVGTLQSEESVIIAAEIAGRIEQIAFAEGTHSRQGDLLIQLDRAVLKAEFDQVVANRNLSASNHRRAEELLKDHAISVQERDEAYARWQLDEANLRLAQARLDKASLHAPFTGTLGLRQVSQGDYVQPGQPLVNLEAIERLKVEFGIPEKYAAKVKVGQPFELQSDAYPGRIFSGQVYAIDPLIEEQSRSLTVRGRIDNQKHELLPGQFVKVQLRVATKVGALFVPEQALIPQPKTKQVFKVVDGKAELIPVVTGSRKKGWVEVTSGLAPGDVIVTGGHQKIGPGSPVASMPADQALFANFD